MPRLLLTTLLVLSSMVFTFPAYAEVSLQTEISQMLIIGFKGKTLTANSPIIQTLQQYPIGGVILFNSSHGPEPDAESAITNVVSPKQLRALTMTLQHYSQIPLFIGVDQEGGRVERLTEAEGFSHMPSAAHLGHLNDVAYTKKQATQLANMLAHVGINLDFTPVVDLALNPKNIVIVQHRRRCTWARAVNKTIGMIKTNRVNQIHGFFKLSIGLARKADDKVRCQINARTSSF